LEQQLEWISLPSTSPILKWSTVLGIWNYTIFNTHTRIKTYGAMILPSFIFTTKLVSTARTLPFESILIKMWFKLSNNFTPQMNWSWPITGFQSLSCNTWSLKFEIVWTPCNIGTVGYQPFKMWYPPMQTI
jgi:hypothetical protein